MLRLYIKGLSMSIGKSKNWKKQKLEKAKNIEK